MLLENWHFLRGDIWGFKSKVSNLQKTVPSTSFLCYIIGVRLERYFVLNCELYYISFSLNVNRYFSWQAQARIQTVTARLSARQSVEGDLNH